MSPFLPLSIGSRPIQDRPPHAPVQPPVPPQPQPEPDDEDGD